MQTSKSIILLATFCLAINLTLAQPLESKITKTSISTDHAPSYATEDLYYGSMLPTPQFAKWKNGYAFVYTDFNMKSYLFFTDANFKKTSTEFLIAGRIVYQLETSNNELALLVGNRYKDEDDEVYSDHIYLRVVNEKGVSQRETFILGTDHLKNNPYATILDDSGHYLLKWTGKMYCTFFPISHNFWENNKDDIHQGDCMYFIDTEGKLYSYSDWGVSHSFEQRLVVSDKYIIAAAKGDAYPRGLEVDHIPVDGYELVLFEEDEEDGNNPAIKAYYESDFEDEFFCESFSSGGNAGDNYVPWSLGDIVVNKDQSALISLSYAENRPLHDVVCVKVKPQDDNCSSGIINITNTPDLCEHSIHMQRVGENKILIMWKVFEQKESDRLINDWNDQWEDEDNSDELIFNERKKFEKNMIALIDNNGKIVVKAQELKNTEFYYIFDTMETRTEWHNVVDVFGNHAYAPMLELNNSAAWLHHERESRQIDVYVFK